MEYISGVVARIDEADAAAVDGRYGIVHGAGAEAAGDRPGPICHLRSATCHSEDVDANV